MTAMRDLSGFGAPSKKPAPARPARKPNSATKTPTAARGTLKTVRASKKRITLSMPTHIASKLKQDSDGSFYLHTILTAFLAHRDAIQAEFEAMRSPLVGLNGARKRQPQGRVQVALLIHAEDLASLDDAANSVELDRSSYIASLIQQI